MLAFITFFNVIIAQDLSDLFEKVEPSVVVIHTEQTNIDPENWQQKISYEGLGSGVLINKKQVITAAHVVQVADEILVKFSDGQQIYAVVVASSYGGELPRDLVRPATTYCAVGFAHHVGLPARDRGILGDHLVATTSGHCGEPSDVPADKPALLLPPPPMVP